jgi:6-phosphogluconolactonase
MAYYVYIALAGENRISIFTMDPDTGHLQFQEHVTLGGSPGPLAVNPDLTFLYAGIRSSSIPGISSFRFDCSTGKLVQIGTVELDADPCFITTDRKGNFLLSAYYGAGVVAVHPIGPDGAVIGSPIEWISTAANAHSIQTDPSNRFAFVPHIAGPNVIFQFKFDENTGKLTPNTVPYITPEEREGPRHFVFHPARDVLYFVNEQGSSVTAYHFDPSAGVLSSFQTISTLPNGFKGENTCSQIHITPSGKFLYASNRGHDSIACFSVDDDTCGLTAVKQQLTEETPRAFNLDPEGNYLFAGGLASGKLASYRIDRLTGALEPLEIYAAGKQPMWVLVVELLL